MPNNAHKHTDMCLSYVIVFAAIEFMAESIIRGWLVHNMRRHNGARYSKKASVERLLNALYANAELNLGSNHTIDYGRICELVSKLAGDGKGAELKRLVDASSPAGASFTIEALRRITTLRHNLAHGSHAPDELSPNLSELKADFNTVYTNLLTNLDNVLRRG